MKHISNEAVMSELWNTFQMKLLWVNTETHFKWNPHEWIVKHIPNGVVVSELWKTFQKKLLWVNCETHLKWSCYERTEKHISNKAVMSELQKHISNQIVMSELWNTFRKKLLWVTWKTHFKWSCYEWRLKHISNEALMS